MLRVARSFAAIVAITLSGCAAHKQVTSRPIADRQTLIGKALFHTGEVNIKDSTLVLESVLQPTFLGTWFDGDLKSEPKPHVLLNCEVWAYEHEGGTYTKLSCDGLGDVFIKQVLFTVQK